jgi:hypothetical protein
MYLERNVNTLIAHHTSKQYSVLVQVWKSVTSVIFQQLQKLSDVLKTVDLIAVDNVFHKKNPRSGESGLAGCQAIVPLLPA